MVQFGARASVHRYAEKNAYKCSAVRDGVVLVLARVIGIAALIAAASIAGAAVLPSAPKYAMHVEKTWIPMKDGVRLAVTLYMPERVHRDERFPALLEYLPYRKDDGTVRDDYGTYLYFAKRWYVGARVDIRGFWASEGMPPDR